ncbi:hypothetical protein BV22DRAFT_524876 [Leucogyrophana mollusca]|uniref:Uncharacterized protein n=1 Tax=Leucogyrophana mollusca TaxID=85980 RepID=A0ACB8BFC9_9AGAM|nr:hypothetical protein BV22DRAFT_524876 [Leucogyrophana mollusca]
MHRCLCIPDILDVVCSNICTPTYPPRYVPNSRVPDPWDSLPQREARTTLACLARTCRVFKDPALDALWSHLKSLEPLMRCLPEDLWIKDEAQSTILNYLRPMLPSDWAKFHNYAQRVRIMGPQNNCSFILLNSADVDVFRSLRPKDCLLPNLRELNWLGDGADYFEFLPLFLAPRLTCLRLSISSSWKTLNAATPFIPAIPLSCPHIKQFICPETDDETWGILEDIVPIVSSLVTQWHFLEHVDTGLLNQAAMSHLSSLQSLKHLCSRPHGRSRRGHVSARFSSNLKSFTLVSRKLEHCERYLEITHIPCAELILALGGLFHMSEWQQFFTRLPLSIPPAHLRILDFERCADQITIPMGWTLETFRPLFAFGDLTVLRAPRFCHVSFSDQDMQEMTSMWPHLQVLDLGTKPDWDFPFLVTLGGVLSLLRNCRELRELGLAIDASVCDPVPIGEEQRADVLNMNITAFHVGCSNIGDPVPIAMFLSNILPRLTKIEFWSSSLKNGDPRQRAWQRVEELLREFASTEG